MKVFSECGAHVQVLFLLALLLLFLLQLYLLNLCYNYREKKRLLFNFFPMLGTLALTAILMRHRNCVECPVPISLAVAIGLTAVLYGYAIAAIAHQRHTHRELLTASSVKDACDHLPFGLCFFGQNELPVLCNGQMFCITGALIGKNMQSFGELKQALAHPADEAELLTVNGKSIYRLPDGGEWFFSQTEIADHEGNRYIQVTAVDHTELNRLNEELRVRNKELKRMMKRLDRIRANITDSIREQEILTAKMRLHNKMGGCMTAARQYYMQELVDEPAVKNKAKKAELLNNWNRTVADLEEEIGQTDDSDPIDELVSIAKMAGLEIAVNGQMPADPEVYYLFIMGLRECINNAIHHAAASLLTVTVTHEGETVTGVYTNDGKAPEQEIVEGGGLTSLRKRIESEGGTMAVRSFPAFALTITLPEKLKSEEDDDDDDDECIDC